MKPRVEKLYQKVANAIATAIGEGQYAIGTRLPGERELAEDFSVSRPTVREAMIALEIRGLVEARHGSGLYVTSLPNQSEAAPELDVGAFELIEARILFEGEACAVAATVIDDATLAELDRALADMTAFDPASAEALHADRRFHTLIAESTGNTVISSVVENLWNIREHSPLCAHMFAEARGEGVNPRVDEHQLIVDALRARDPEQARRTMHLHLRRVVEDLLSATELDVMERARSEIHQRRVQVARRLGIGHSDTNERPRATAG
ncbi:FadR/GntR family transcriptional regulator [Sphingomonas mollis]|uniref:FadR family transcriptional regulator n=1 Tax=Sphingomonas mollis TaxID=2795726 RepID=A0ABS0XN56_9SPHN|nr:FadR family transcriptional regulator [Sphingomonas sp. BT553]